MTQKRKQSGLALADLLVGLMIGAIVLAAAAAMADAMSHGKRATEQISRTSGYLAQVHTRMADLVMRAEAVEARPGGGVVLTYSGGRTIELYPDASQRLVIDDSGGVMSYLSDPAQTAATVTAADAHRVEITLAMSENGQTQSYTMTAARRGGQ